MASSVADDHPAHQDDAASIQSNLYHEPPAVASPDDDDNESVAAARAEVMTNQAEAPTRRGRDPTADQAVMGAAEEDNFEIMDESGELVKSRFLEFLMEYRELVEGQDDTED